jgi:solute carrier family 25 protein 39/40
VPFSCLYWLSYEEIKRRATAAHPRGQFTTLGAFVAGALAGMLAALLTCPLDVVKTRQMLHEAGAPAGMAGGVAGGVAAPPPSAASSTSAVLAQIVRTEGWRGLYAGVGARLAKVAPACAIMIGSYEAGKGFFAASGSGVSVRALQSLRWLEGSLEAWLAPPSHLVPPRRASFCHGHRMKAAVSMR